jgi:hypothetical protein
MISRSLAAEHIGRSSDEIDVVIASATADSSVESVGNIRQTYVIDAVSAARLMQQQQLSPILFKQGPVLI